MGGMGFAIVLVLAILVVGSMFTGIGPHLLGRLVGTKIAVAKNEKCAEKLVADLKQKDPTFNPDRSFIRGFNGIAFDTKAGRVYVGIIEGGALRSAIYPIKYVVNYHSGDGWANNVQKFFLDITFSDVNSPLWRLWFGTDSQDRAEVMALMDVLIARS